MYWIGAVVLVVASQALPAHFAQDNRAAAYAAVDAFRHQQDAGAFEAIRDGGTPALREESATSFVERMRAHQAQMGPFVSAVRDYYGAREDSKGTTITILYKAQYRNGRATERFDFHPVNGKMALEAFTVMEAQRSGA